MKTRTTILCAALSASCAFAKTSTPEGWLDDYDAALEKAAAENKCIVADFSGSDWCGWCKRLDKEVFATDEFRKAAAEKYVLLMVDSPRDKSLLSPKAAKENPKLVEKFGIHGFPTVVVLDAKGEEVCRLGYESGGPGNYLKKLDSEIQEAPEVRKYIKPIEDVLNRYDSQMQKEAMEAMKKAQEKFPTPGKDASEAEARKAQRELSEYMQKVMFEEICPKYIPLYEKAFEEAKAMKVPKSMKARKKALVSGQRRNFNALKKAYEAYNAAKQADAGKKGGAKRKGKAKND